MSIQTKALRKLLNSDDYIVAPCAFDALSAKLIENAGFNLCGTTGYGMHGAMLGTPDAGLLAFNEAADAYEKMCDAVNIPIMADGEGGYGNAINTMRTVRVFEKAGLAGMFIEDQKIPVNCPFLKKTETISIEEMCGKIRAAVDARKDKDFIIVARTDAPFEEAVERGNAYLEAGADMIKPIPMSRKELEAFPEKIHGPLHLGFTPGKEINLGLTAKDAGDMGYKIITFPMTALFLGVKAIMEGLKRLKEDENDDAILGDMISLDEYFKFIGKEKFLELNKKYLAE